MWLTKKLSKSQTSVKLADGMVTSASNNTTVQAESEYRNVSVCAPFGISSLPPEDTKAVMINGLCIGVVVNSQGINHGELRLNSAGGAEILLKNNGEVWINGQCFKPKEGA